MFYDAPAFTRIYDIPLGDAGTYRTLGEMRSLVNKGLQDPLTLDNAGAIIAGTGGRSGEAAAEAIRLWLQQRVKFVPDPHRIELLRTPRRLWRQTGRFGFGLGDCDDVAIWGATLGKAVGLPARFAVLGFGPGPRPPFRHVYTELFTGRRWRDLDTTKPAYGGMHPTRLRYEAV